MSAHVTPPTLDIIPEGAPFTPAQRAWLNGFFAALLTDTGPAAVSATEAMAGGPVLASNDDAPWHDPSLALPDRMAMAAEKPLAPRLMAAMAQQDCGQCGYSCADYANAIFGKSEKRLNLCAPGGKDTQRMLRQLAEELAAPAAGGSLPQATPAMPAAERPAGDPGRSRENPVEAVFLGRRRLNREGSEKYTYHIEFDLSESGLDYVVGDSFGVFAPNHPALADAVVAALGARPEGLVGGRPLRELLIHDLSLGVPSDTLFQLFSYVCGGDLRRKAQALASGEDPDGDVSTLDVLAVLHKFAGHRPSAEAFVEALEPLQPRLYSISSSPRAQPGLLTLTVDEVRYRIGGRARLGVASTFLAGRIEPGARLKVYVQKAHGFGLPQDASAPVIMIGPGTGVAPFRAFLQDRQASSAPGRNWLFYGHQRRAHDFLYEEEFAAMQASGALTRLSLAWSRDTAEKFYVQDRLRQVGAEIWQWLAEGAHVYVCGDAKRMARDVERALVDVVAQWGARSTDEAIAFVAGLKKAGRYQADVY